MSVVTQIIELSEEMSLPAIQRRLARAQGPRVLLVLPRGGQVLANPARLRVIRRQARQQGLQVALVTSDRLTRQLAGEAGLQVFATVRRGERARRWRQPGPEEPLPDPSGPRHAPPPGRVGHRRKGRPQPLLRRDPPPLPDRRSPRWRPWAEALGLFVFLLLCLASLAALLLFVVPAATVTLVPPRQSVTVTVPVVAAVGVEEVDYTAGQVPARVVQTRVEGYGSIATTGRRNAPADPATGRVVFINRGTNQVQVPELTVVGTSTGINVRFRVTQAVTVPAGIGMTVEAPIEALQPGPSGNVPAFTITRIEGPLGLVLRVINDQATQGGSVREVGVVTEADKEQLRASLLAEVRQESYQRLGEMLREGEFVPPETVKTYVLAETFDRFAGEDAETLGLRLELLARGLAVDTHGGQEIAGRALRAQVPADVRLLDERPRFALGPMTILDEEQGRVQFDVTATATVVGGVNSDAVRAAIRGLELPEALAVLRRDFEWGAEPRLTLRPDWLGRVPWLPFRIYVRVVQG
ncbi:MAG: baseplate J/gp47 family protein [Anaerolineae bacterium]|nr:baseplate J/gp47 family protein [Anaerolineae bacterium]